jgi:hypothetical protein
LADVDILDDFSARIVEATQEGSGTEQTAQAAVA